MLEFPPKASCKIRVNFEFLNVMNWSLFLSMVDRADITFPSSKRPKLILIPSLRVSPVAPVFFALYEPAKSAKKNLEWVIPDNPYSFLSSLSTFSGSLSIYMVKMAWDRELISFILVCLVVLCIPPLSSNLIIYYGVATTSLTTPSTLTNPVSLSSLIVML